MLRPLPDLPLGVIGFEAVGEVTADDYREVLRPAVEAAANAGPLRIVYVMGPEFSGYATTAYWEDTKMGLGHLGSWERVAVVTDVGWVEHLVTGFAWMVPGDLRRFPVDERDAAVRWAAGMEAEPEPEVAPAAEPEPVVAPVVAPGEASTGEIPPVAAPPEQWAPDPSGRHQHRWWNGREWTEHVADNGVSSLDPLA